MTATYIYTDGHTETIPLVGPHGDPGAGETYRYQAPGRDKARKTDTDRQGGRQADRQADIGS